MPEEDQITRHVRRIRTRNQLLQNNSAGVTGGNLPGGTSSVDGHVGPRVPYPNVLSVSHSDFVSLPRGITALRDTPALYIESETAVENDGELYFYNVVDAFGRYLYTAQEISCHQGGSRPFALKIIDLDEQDFATIKRSPTWGLCCFGSKCIGNDAVVKYNSGYLIGEIRQIRRAGLKYGILDDTGNEVMRVEGPERISCFHPRIGKREKVELYFVNPENPKDSSLIGTFNVISQEKLTAGIVFGMQFPLELTPEYKLLVLAAGFLLNFTFCETQPSRCLNWYGSGWVILVLFCAVLLSVSVILCVLWYLYKYPKY